MKIKTITIASRESPLAIWQAEYIKSKINILYPDIKIKIKSKFWFDLFNRPTNKSLDFLKAITNKKQRKNGPKA